MLFPLLILICLDVDRRAPALIERTLALVCCCGLLALVGCGQATPKPEDPNRPLLWGADEEGGAPYISKEDGKYVGFEVELAGALEKELGRPLKFTQYPFKDLDKGLRRGDIDLAMNGLEVTEDRKSLMRFSRPYYIFKLQLVTRTDDERFKSLNDLEGKKDVKVGTLANTAASRLLEKLAIPMTTFDDQVNPYKKLAQEQLDAVLLDLPIAIYVVQKNDELNKKLKFVGAPVDPGQYAIAFRTDDEALAKQFDQALEKLIQKGELKRIYEKWGLWNDDQLQLGTGLKEPKAGSPVSSAPSK